MASSLLSSTSPVLPNIAMTLLAIPALVGTFSLLLPRTALAKVFDFPLPAKQTDQAVVVSLTQLFGARDTFMSGAALGAWYTGDRMMLGYLCMLAAGVSVVDGVAQAGVSGPGSEWKHWWLVPVEAGIGAGLMGWFGAVR